MPFGFGGTSSSKSSTSSPGFGAGSMAAGRASERSNYGGSTSSKSSTSSSKGSTATAAGRGSNAATGSKSSGAGATGGRVGSGSTSANRGSISGGGDVGRFGGGSTGTTGKGFGTATGFGSSGSMAAARANDRASVAGYAGRPSATSTTTGARVGAGSMAAARAADRASVTGYSGANAAAPGTMANARAADRASVPGYSAVSPPSGRTTLRGLGTALSRMTPTATAPTSQALADRLNVPGLTGTLPGQVTNAPLGVVQNIPGGIPMGATVSALPDLAKAPKAFVNWPKGVTRPTTDVPDRIAAAWAEELGPENVQINAVSGLRTSKKGTRSHRHGPDIGTALDYGVSIRDPKTNSWRSLDLSKVADKALATRVSQIGMAKYGLQGAGFGLGYMGDKSIHHDVYTNLSPTQTKQWAGAKVSAAAFNAARAEYSAASKAPARPSGPAQPVSSMIADAARETTPQMAALDQASGVTRPTAVASNVSRVTAPQSVAAQPAATRPAATAASVASPVSRPVATPVSRPSPAKTSSIPGQLAIQTPTKEAPYKRSLTGEVVAAGIDVLGGPLGAVASLATGLTLGTTVGGAAWDAAHGRWGENQYSPGSENVRQGGGSEADAQRATDNAAKAAAKAGDGGAGSSTPAEDFVTKYIEFKDPTWQSPQVKFTSSVEPMVLTPPKYNFEAPTAPFTYRRV